jgi:hypothetical protein
MYMIALSHRVALKLQALTCNEVWTYEITLIALDCAVRYTLGFQEPYIRKIRA